MTDEERMASLEKSVRDMSIIELLELKHKADEVEPVIQGINFTWKFNNILHHKFKKERQIIIGELQRRCDETLG